MSFDYARDGGDYLFFVNFNDPSTGQPYGQGAGANQISAVAFRVLDPSTTPATVLLGTTAGVYDSVLQQWKLAWTFGGALNSKRVVAVEAIPTRGGSVSPALWPEVRKLVDVTDALKRQDEIEVKIDTTNSAVDALQTDFDAFESANQSEHDTTQAAVAAHEALRASMETTLVLEHNATQVAIAALQTDFDNFEAVNLTEHGSTQSLISQINGAANALLYGPSIMPVPSIGTTVYKLRFRLRDLDQTPVALVDPDNNRVTITVKDVFGATPAGIALSDADPLTAGAQGLRLSTGDYETEITVDASAPSTTPLIFEATWARSGVVDSVLFVVILTDVLTQLDRIEANTQSTEEAVGMAEDTILAAIESSPQFDVNLIP